VDPGSFEIDNYMLTELAVEMNSEDVADRICVTLVLGRFGKGPGVLEILKQIISNDPVAKVRSEARSAYAKLKNRIEQSLVETMKIQSDESPLRIDQERCWHYLRHRNPIYRIEAVLQILRLRDAVCLPLIIERLGQEKDAWVVATLVRAVGQLGHSADLELILPFLSWHDHPRVISNTIDSIALINSVRAPALIEPFLESRNSRVLASAARGLYRTDREKALRKLRDMAQSPQGSVQASAVYALTLLEDRDSESILREMLRSEPSERLKKKIVAHLDKIAGRRATKTV